MSHPNLILVTRRSPLALQQSHWVQVELERKLPGCRVELLTLGTTGDRLRHQPLPQIGGKGLFTKELEEALLQGRAQLAVHSLKDLPTELAPGLILAAVPPREDVRDVLVSRSGRPFAELPRNARIGTSSLRRAAQLQRLRRDLRIESLRGNLDTRLRKAREGPLDAVVLAAAGIHRMGWATEITEYFPPETLLPAVGQGALGIEARAGDLATLPALALLEDPWARISVMAERSLLRRLGGGCQIPIAAFTSRSGDQISLTGLVLRPDGSEFVQATESATLTGPDAAEELGRKTAERLLQQGAGTILESLSFAPGTLPTPQAP